MKQESDPVPDKLSTPVQFLKGVGTRRAEQLARLEIRSVEDVLYWVPRRYEDRRLELPIGDAKSGDVMGLTGTVRSSGWVRSRYGKPYFEVVIQDSSGLASCRWFHANYLQDVLRLGQRIRVFGKVLRRSGSIVMNHPEYELVHEEGEGEEEESNILPVYPSTEALSQKVIRRFVASAMDLALEAVQETIPERWREPYGYPDVQECLRRMHRPNELNEGWKGRERLAFEEFLGVQLVLVARRMQSGRIRKPHGYAEKRPTKPQLIECLPFELTGAQKRVLQEIEKDMVSPHPMHRLLQGDVGSGKTLVAICSAVDAVDSGLQVVFLAPTEILARQHHQNVERLLESFQIRVHRLLGETRARERREILAGLRTGRIQILVGTHAVLQEDVQFRNLGLAIIDEQHKFGVAQRGVLYSKSQHPDMLVMTATPIPRTLAMTLYGDLDISIMDELPGGRQAIVTRVIADAQREAAYGFIVQQVEKGRQAYLVYPLINESDRLELKSAVTMFEALGQTVFRNLRIGLLHGQLATGEKEGVMRRFRDGELDVLVATTVIEVGVDVPNASVMMIEHADRFGLAQLHQLRGRIGRGEHKSFCILQGEAKSKDAWRRLKVMEASTDGFVIAEEDLKIRGMGNIMGAEQSGMPRFRVGNVLADARLLQKARQTAEAILGEDPKLEFPEHVALRERAKRIYRMTAPYVQVG